MPDHYGNHRCHKEKNVPTAFILPRRWQDGAESLGMERTSGYGCVLLSKYFDQLTSPETRGKHRSRQTRN